jgi:hypothetical protein
MQRFSVADPVSGAFLTPWSGAFLTPGSGLGKKTRSGSEMNIRDHIFESSETIFWVKILKLFYLRSGNLFEPGFGMEKFGSGIRDKHPGSATLQRFCHRLRFLSFPFFLLVCSRSSSSVPLLPFRELA